MSEKSNSQGRAFEVAFITELKAAIAAHKINVSIINNSSYVVANKHWRALSISQQEDYIKSAQAGAYAILHSEPLLTEAGYGDVVLEMQPDNAGKVGDVRDIVVKRSGIKRFIAKDLKWEIGFSLKHNHFAAKHSRLAKTLDFGKSWFGYPCSQEYWAEIEPIFSYLAGEKSKGAKWSDLPQKAHDVYTPLLNAFIDELRRTYNEHNDVPKKMVSYLLGKYDFYKVVSVDAMRETEIQPYNLNGKLNQSKKTRPEIIIPKTKLPSRIVKIEMRPDKNNTVDVYLDSGWQFAFRIHNASTFVETSLKFDVQIIGIPATVVKYTVYRAW
jgi:hypothetical protein